MNTHHTMYRSSIRVLLATAFLLTIPLVAMQFTDEVAWGPLDFVLMGALLVGTGLAYQAAVLTASHVAYRTAMGLALAGVFLLPWVSLAVGIIGGEDNPTNLMYLGVIAVALVGAGAARLRPRGMARAMVATALVQALVTVIALIFRLGAPANGPMEILMGNGLFVALFIGSAALFLEAADAGAGRSTE